MPERRKDDVSADDFMTVRELNTHFTGIHGKLDEIHTQTKSTNGRVGKLESWRDRMLGGMTIMVLLILPLLLFVLKQWLQGRINIDASFIDMILAWAMGV